MASIASCMQAQAAEQPEPEVVPVTPRIAWIQQATEEFPGNIVTELIRVCGEGGSLDDLLEMSDMEITLRAYRYGLNPVNWEPHVALFNTIRHKKIMRKMTEASRTAGGPQEVTTELRTAHADQHRKNLIILN
ncbi:uncharacterized protein L3040_004097 [Drepanopeziza brunnea f. sp. 'multigermtubi']|uniref:uncharacterized protein n=1 Tax=Drepanopeziza brunnea f. sp. 'multigermtubi' TaxID=698441 RepID=UPI0023A5E749|nr:hypothetical protein L3040_004097 [Drepanopeziza brunnea f. sp. 'multigermtubi']